jgi:hypothetical protein
MNSKVSRSIFLRSAAKEVRNENFTEKINHNFVDNLRLLAELRAIGDKDASRNEGGPQ